MLVPGDGRGPGEPRSTGLAGLFEAHGQATLHAARSVGSLELMQGGVGSIAPLPRVLVELMRYKHKGPN